MFFLSTSNLFGSNKFFIRINQLGFLPGDIKTGIVISEKPLGPRNFVLRDFITKKELYRGEIKPTNLKYGNFQHNYDFDFSGFSKPGKYFIEINNVKSYSFRIGSNIYNRVVDSLMVFFKVQRCGYTHPYMHKACHPVDVTKLIDGKDTIYTSKDVTGGWHDAGDYIKFLNTTAYTTYTLLFAYDFDPQKFGFDNNKDGVPDILAEAKIGLDWLLRAEYKKYKLITQVQDLRDHDVGWRMPSKDPLAYDRPGFIGVGKNLIGIYSATLALASRIWRKVFHENKFADKCLTAAENLYSVRNEVPNIDSSGTGMYLDDSYYGKLALGAVELYLTTKRVSLLKEAETFADSAKSDYWWSYGDINAYADYRLAKIKKRFGKYILNNLVKFNDFKNTKLFGRGADYSWGTNNTLLGVTLQWILWHNLTNKQTYDSLAIFQRDYILGRNPWGISFISKIGTNYTRNFHHQVAFLTGGYLPGGLAAGPAKRSLIKKYKIRYATKDKYSLFQSDSVVYRDDRMDYITNEPTISSDATAVFVMGYFSKN